MHTGQGHPGLQADVAPDRQTLQVLLKAPGSLTTFNLGRTKERSAKSYSALVPNLLAIQPRWSIHALALIEKSGAVAIHDEDSYHPS